MLRHAHTRTHACTVGDRHVHTCSVGSCHSCTHTRTHAHSGWITSTDTRLTIVVHAHALGHMHRGRMSHTRTCAPRVRPACSMLCVRSLLHVCTQMRSRRWECRDPAGAGDGACLSPCRGPSLSIFRLPFPDVLHSSRRPQYPLVLLREGGSAVGSPEQQTPAGLPAASRSVWNWKDLARRSAVPPPMPPPAGEHRASRFGDKGNRTWN